MSHAALEACYLRAVYHLSHHSIYLPIQRPLWYLLHFFSRLNNLKYLPQRPCFLDLWPVSLFFSGFSIIALRLSWSLMEYLSWSFTCIKQNGGITPTGYIPVDKSQLDICLVCSSLITLTHAEFVIHSKSEIFFFRTSSHLVVSGLALNSWIVLSTCKTSHSSLLSCIHLIYKIYSQEVYTSNLGVCRQSLWSNNKKL